MAVLQMDFNAVYALWYNTDQTQHFTGRPTLVREQQYSAAETFTAADVLQ